MWGLLLAYASSPANADTTFTVNSTGDQNDTDFPGGAFDGTSDAKCDVDSGAQGDQCTLRAAIQEANVTVGADTITFDSSLSGQTITLASELPAITELAGLTIDGGSADITVSGGGSVRVFFVEGGILTLNKLTVANGHATFGSGGGILNIAGALTVNNSTFSGNSADEGGAITTIGDTTVNNSTFYRNSARGTFSPVGGGGILNTQGILTVNNSTFSENSSNIVDSGGGGIRNSQGILTVNNSTFSDNSADIGGGINTNGSATLSNSTFSGSLPYTTAGCKPP